LSTPSITNLNPTSGAVGTLVTIAGTNFGSTQGTSTVAFEPKVVNTVFLTDGLSSHRREIEYFYENTAGTTRNAVAGVYADAQTADAANG
jgi:hypothetical protein